VNTHSPHSQAGPLPPDRLLDTANARSLAIWHDVLTLQVDLFLTEEIAALRASAAWRNAKNVLEAGCGNGRYLAALAWAFPDKTYLGIDRSEGLIALAEAEHAGVRTGFAVGDFLATAGAGSFDAVVMRFVVQHLSDLPAVLRRAATYLKPGGTVFIIEPDVQNSANTPPTPAFDAMLREYAALAAERGRLRVQLQALPALIADQAGWTVERDRPLTVTSRGPFVASELLRLYEAWTGLCEHQGSFDFDFAKVRAELERWSQLDASRSRIGLRLLEAKWSGGKNDRN
jgi:SAM-dependent methyltransferase